MTTRTSADLDRMIATAQTLAPAALPAARKQAILDAILDAPSPPIATVAAPVIDLAARRARPRTWLVGAVVLATALAAAALLAFALHDDDRVSPDPRGDGAGSLAAGGPGSGSADDPGPGLSSLGPSGGSSAMVGTDPETSPMVSALTLEARQVSGDRNILPPPSVRDAIARTNRSARLVVPLKICVDPAGVVASAKVETTSGYPAYDAALEAGVRTWRYQPLIVDGKAMTVCAVVQFVYTQK